ncbi:MAG: adenosine kinase [Bdellovibrionales bacterium]|nr:adenosine kinase [Bdellovibrionales bacterium]
MKTIDVYGLGNGIVDVLVEVTESEFQKLGFEKGTMALLDESEQQRLISSLAGRDMKLVSGGSVANSIVLLSQLGGKAAFSCRLADDNYGLHYRSEFDGIGVDLPSPLRVGGQSGTSLIFITPDAERTMRTSLGVSATFGNAEVDEDVIRQSKWIFLEGYLFCNPASGHGAIEYACELAKKHNTKIALTLSDAWIMNEFREAVEKTVQVADLVFSNDGEAKALAQVASGEEAFEKLKGEIPNLVVTLGKEGCLVKTEGFSGHTPSLQVDPVDLTGAGDAFAGSFLYGLISGTPAHEIPYRANFLAAHVIQRIGARIHGDAKELWESAGY